MQYSLIPGQINNCKYNSGLLNSRTLDCDKTQTALRRTPRVIVEIRVIIRALKLIFYVLRKQVLRNRVLNLLLSH